MTVYKKNYFNKNLEIYLAKQTDIHIPSSINQIIIQKGAKSHRVAVW